MFFENLTEITFPYPAISAASILVIIPPVPRLVPAPDADALILSSIFTLKLSPGFPLLIFTPVSATYFTFPVVLSFLANL